jgi:hypothetical protein
LLQPQLAVSRKLSSYSSSIDQLQNWVDELVRIRLQKKLLNSRAKIP